MAHDVGKIALNHLDAMLPSAFTPRYEILILTGQTIYIARGARVHVKIKIAVVRLHLPHTHRSLHKPIVITDKADIPELAITPPHQP